MPATGLHTCHFNGFVLHHGSPPLVHACVYRAAAPPLRFSPPFARRLRAVCLRICHWTLDLLPGRTAVWRLRGSSPALDYVILLRLLAGSIPLRRYAARTHATMPVPAPLPSFGFCSGFVACLLLVGSLPLTCASCALPLPHSCVLRAFTVRCFSLGSVLCHLPLLQLALVHLPLRSAFGFCCGSTAGAGFYRSAGLPADTLLVVWRVRRVGSFSPTRCAAACTCHTGSHSAAARAVLFAFYVLLLVAPCCRWTLHSSVSFAAGSCARHRAAHTDTAMPSYLQHLRSVLYAAGLVSGWFTVMPQFGCLCAHNLPGPCRPAGYCRYRVHLLTPVLRRLLPGSHRYLVAAQRCYLVTAFACAFILYRFFWGFFVSGSVGLFTLLYAETTAARC